MQLQEVQQLRLSHTMVFVLFVLMFGAFFKKEKKLIIKLSNKTIKITNNEFFC